MISFEFPERFFFLFSLIPLFFFFLIDLKKRAHLLEWYEIDKKNRKIHFFYRSVAFFAFCATTIFIIFALAAPYKEKKEHRKEKIFGEEILFMVDVSRSMLAQDVLPSRLEKVKIDLIEMVNKHKGAAMGLVAFAGDAVIKCPMTTDLFFLTAAIEELQVGSVSRGSTSIASALREVLKMLPHEETGNATRNIVLFTDGEDHEEDPVPIARQIEKTGGRILLIAIGNNQTGARIPLIDENGNKSYLVYQGQEIWSKTDLTVLKTITENCPNCALVPALDHNYDLNSHYEAFNTRMGPAKKNIKEAEILIEVDYLFSPFITLALFCLIATLFFFEFSRWRLKVE